MNSYSCSSQNFQRQEYLPSAVIVSRQNFNQMCPRLVPRREILCTGGSLRVSSRVGSSARLSVTKPETVAPKPVTSPVPSRYSTGKPLKLNLPKLSYAGPRGVGAAEAKLVQDSWEPSQLQAPLISKDDRQFAEELGVQFVEGAAHLDVEELNDLFEKVGFPRRSPQRLSLALQQTHRVLWIRCTRPGRGSRVGSLVGFARATSDGALTATIWDVAVHPCWQRSGIGTGLIERLLTGLVSDGIPHITLYAEPHAVELYERLGFVREPQSPIEAAAGRKQEGELVAAAS
uniref:Histone acetyltransferase n=1 Tax=Tetraselmis sp. GSL018 TaxID=582737 RepID=A0A061S221_9CHLO|mmetsp:Transcript_37799/g.89755  ORF Transcript_37799/g.89755 Transcript_37799/m.89755 type:complete len:288 (-) Transcript_37799:435-1298(-)